MSGEHGDAPRPASAPSGRALEQNLHALFARAWRPVVARPEFRARVADLVAGRVDARVAAQAGPRRAARPGAPATATRLRRLAPLALAAALIGALFVLARLVAPDGPALQPNAPENVASDAPADVRAADDLLPRAADAPAGVASDLAAGAPQGPERAPLAAAPHEDVAAPVGDVPQRAPEPAGARLVGRVVAADDGTPIEAFQVVLLAQVRLPDVAEPEAHAFADAHGVFAIDGVRPGRSSVFVVADGHAVRRVDDVTLSEGVEHELALALEVGRVVRGRVVDTSGAPIEGALVLSERDAPLQTLPLDPTLIPPGVLRAAHSGPDGHYELAHVSSGKHLLRTSAAGHGAAWSQPIELGDLEPEAEVDFVLGPGASLSGAVADDDGQPWPGAIVIASLIDSTFERPCMSFGMAITDAQGLYAIADLPAGTYAVLNPSESQRYRRPPTVRSVQLDAGAALVVDLPGDASGSETSGRLVDAEGVPLPDYDLTLYELDDQEGFRSTRTDAEGRFAFEGLLPGDYLVYCGRSMGVDMTLVGPLSVPDAGVRELVLATGSASLAGRVLEGQHRTPLAEAVLILERGDASGAGRVFAGRAATDTHGAWRFEGLAPGEYRVSAYALTESLGEERHDGVTLMEGEQRVLGELVLWPGADLELCVRDGEGRPVEGVLVLFEDELGRDVAFGIDDRTDAHGVLRVRGVRPGRWTVTAQHDGRRAQASLVVRVAERNQVVLDLR